MVIQVNQWETTGLDNPQSLLRKDQLVAGYLKLPQKFKDASYYHPTFKKTQVSEWLVNRWEPSGKPIAILIGGTGCGKSYAAVAYFLKMVPVVISYDRVTNCQGLIVSAYELAEKLIRKDYAFLDRAKRVSWLLIDELGTEPTGWKGNDFQAHFESLFNARYENDRKTILISNFTHEQFKEHYGERISSRLAEAGLGLSVSDTDYRRKNHERL